MILTLFTIFTLIGLVLIGLGIFNNDMLVLAVAGCGIIFILGTILLAGSVTYKDGENITTNYYYIDNTTQIDNTTEITTINYSDFSDDNSHWLGFLYMACGILGFVGVIIQTRSGYRGEE